MGKSWSSMAPIPLRLMLGIGFMYHGYPKLFTAEGRGDFEGMLQNLGVPMPAASAWVVGLVEFVGGLALILGVLVTLASVLLIVNMLVALFKVHLAHGFSFINITGTGDAGPQFGMPGYEVNLLYIAGLLALAVGGPGAMSLVGAGKRSSAEAGGETV